jgi:uncharacterized phage protein gp47/JayE
VADYGLARLSASTATGHVTFGRFTDTQQALIPIGAGLRTADGTQQFTVTLDATLGSYSQALGGYVIPANTASLSVPVAATNAGAAGNVLAGSVTVLTTPIPGVDTVANAAGFINGLDAETDAALRSRFVLYLASLSKATKTAVGYAVTSLQQGLNYTITEDYDYDGTYDPGFFFVVVDDGSGTPSDELLSTVYNAIDAVRGLGIRFAVFAPVVVAANVGMTIASAPGYTHANVVGAVGAALADYINALPLGASLPYTRLDAVAYGVPGVVNVTAVTLNSGTSDLSADAKTVIKSGTITVA